MSIRTVIVLLLATVALQPQRASREAASPTGTGAIAGVVTSADDGAMLPGTRVTLVSRDASLVRTVNADAQGRFEFTALPASRFTLVARRAGYAESPFGAVRPGGTGVTIHLDAGERLQAPIVMARVSVVAGTIFDDVGQPTNALVKIFQRAYQRGAISLKEITRVESGRDGQYRIEDLPPGEYLVRAERIGSLNVTRVDSRDVEEAKRSLAGAGATPRASTDTPKTYTYVPVYFPDALGSARATTIRLDAGVVRTGLDIRLQLIQTTTIEGQLTTSSGAPLANGRVALFGEDDEVVTYYGATTADGRYRFLGVPIGRYTMVTADLPRPSIPLPQRAATYSRAEFFVSPDAPGLPVFVEQVGGPVVGAVIFDGAAAVPSSQTVSVRLLPVDGPFVGYVTATDGGVMLDPSPTWQVLNPSVPPGRYLVTVSGLEAPWRLRAATSGGRDIATSPIEIAAGRATRDLAIVLTDRGTRLTGSITTADGAPVISNTLLIFGADPGGWIERSRRVRALRPDSRGGFEVDDLPAGEYLIALASDLDPSDRLDASVLARFAPGAVRVTLVEGRDVVQHLRVAR
jgi:hypothetical protein